jgi:hypothetical protein
MVDTSSSSFSDEATPDGCSEKEGEARFLLRISPWHFHSRNMQRKKRRLHTAYRIGLDMLLDIFSGQMRMKTLEGMERLVYDVSMSTR